MKKILLLFILIFSVTTQAQTYPVNPTPFGKISINNNIKQNSATRVLVQDSLTKQVNWVLKSNFSLDANVLHKNSTPETKTGFLTTYGSNVTDGTYNYSLSLQPIRNQFAAFFNQPFYGSDQGYYVFRPSGTNIPSRFYIMPNGTVTGTTSKFEMFNNDYSANFTTYNGVNLLLNNTSNQIDFGSNRGVAGGVRQKLRIGGDYAGSVFQTNSSAIDMNTDNTININPFGGAVSIGTAIVDPFSIGLSHQVTFKNPVSTEPMRLNLIGNGWAAGVYFGRDAIRTASIATQAALSDLEISTNPTNSGTGLTANIRIWAATGNIAIQNGGTFTDNGDRFQVTGNASGSLAASLSNHFMRKGEVDTALALKANLSSPPLTGTPTAPTATAGTNTTQIATTAFVTNAASSANFVDLTSTQAITGIKSFNNTNSTTAALNANASGTGTVGALFSVSNTGSALVVNGNSSSGVSQLIQNTGTATGVMLRLQNINTASSVMINGQNAAGVTLFNVDALGNVIGNSFVKTAGTADQILLANGTVGIRPKLYKALITQTGTSAPTVTVLGDNTIGTVVWTRTGIGAYTGTLSGAFTANKTALTNNNTSSGSILFNSPTANTVTISTTDLTGTSLDGKLTNTTIQIEVFP